MQVIRACVVVKWIGPRYLHYLKQRWISPFCRSLPTFWKSRGPARALDRQRVLADLHLSATAGQRLLAQGLELRGQDNFRILCGMAADVLSLSPVENLERTKCRKLYPFTCPQILQWEIALQHRRHRCWRQTNATVMGRQAGQYQIREEEKPGARA